MSVNVNVAGIIVVYVLSVLLCTNMGCSYLLRREILHGSYSSYSVHKVYSIWVVQE